MNSRLKKMVNDISGNDFKQITLEFGSENLNFLKQRDAYPYEYERFWKIFWKRFAWQKSFL